jgi:DtxR family Mn-dependent transcriptional regulator
MANHIKNISSMSESIEMYLVRVAQLQQPGRPVPISQLAQELSVTSVSANEMCRKLTKKGLVEYEPYKGVTLTPDGYTLAQRVLRSRHLWETFFIEKLGFGPTEADAIACRFEHVTPDELADRLAAFLDMSVFSSASHGHQICCLTELTAGKQGRVIDLTAADVTNTFLKQQGIAVGKTVTVLSLAAGVALLLEVSGQPISLSHSVAQTVMVAPEKDKNELV